MLAVLKITMDEVFNLKLRCQQYELRLAELTLNGANGGKLSLQYLSFFRKTAAREPKLE